MNQLPKGITPVRYNTRHGEVTKYRVRIKTKDFAFNKVFERLELAEEALKLSQTIAGRNLLTNAIQGIDELQERREVAKLLSGEFLKLHLPEHFELHLKKPEIEEKDKRNNKTYLYMISVICNTEIPNYVVDEEDTRLCCTNPPATAW